MHGNRSLLCNAKWDHISDQNVSLYVQICLSPLDLLLVPPQRQIKRHSTQNRVVKKMFASKIQHLHDKVEKANR